MQYEGIPYPLVDVDEDSGVKTPSEKARAWQEGYNAGYKDALKATLNIMVGSKK